LFEVPALKEWAANCAALVKGSQQVVLRKGGIEEKAFDVVARRFLLFPTSFHSGADCLQDGAAQEFQRALAFEPKKRKAVKIFAIAEVAGAWTTSDPSIIEETLEFHMWKPEYLEKRLSWKPEQPMTLLDLRVRRLKDPLMVPNKPELWGCFSWVQVPSPWDIDALWESGKPVDAMKSVDAATRKLLRYRLQAVSDLQELSIGGATLE